MPRVGVVVDSLHNELEETDTMRISKFKCGASDIFLSLDFSQAGKRMVGQLCCESVRGV
jgi:hypothetical protein